MLCYSAAFSAAFLCACLCYCWQYTDIRYQILQRPMRDRALLSFVSDELSMTAFKQTHSLNYLICPASTPPCQSTMAGVSVDWYNIRCRHRSWKAQIKRIHEHTHSLNVHTIPWQTETHPSLCIHISPNTLQHSIKAVEHRFFSCDCVLVRVGHDSGPFWISILQATCIGPNSNSM